MERLRQPGRTSAIALGAAILGAGFLLGSLTRPSSAWAAPPVAGAGSASFGFAVPANGFALVSDAAGNAWVIGPNGSAMRVLYSISGSAPDRPGRTENQLPLR